LTWADSRNFLFNFKYSAGIWNMDREGMSVCGELNTKLNDRHGIKNDNVESGNLAILSRV